MTDEPLDPNILRIVQKIDEGLFDDQRTSEEKATDKLNRSHPRTRERRDALNQLVEEEMEPPMSVRQVFYQAASVKKLVEKVEKGYRVVQADLKLLRDAGIIPYEHITDNTRRMLKPTTFDTPQEALSCAAVGYRKSLWGWDADCVVHMWVEKDALSGVISSITDLYDVPLFVARGYSSISFLKKAALRIEDEGVPVYVYHLGDFDPSGQDAAENIEKRLREMAPDAEIYFEQLAVTEQQIRELNLPSRPTKKSDTRSASFGDQESVELDAIPPHTLRQIVRDAIERHLPPDRYEELMEEQEKERKFILAAIEDKNEALVSEMEAYLAWCRSGSGWKMKAA
jgi:DNA-binding transcriptional ArsR family regulator